eukprot:TRINITY_DN22186_c0_g1_i1.p1 TRINITY_DN22186_c0_g1~~TRINITY_DN22186_c0_g1_i1.p1  ORF type:complete len:403 (-),score=59.25 TRINITY_DN22186_c0_g1_i1:170-1339(-)
MEKGIRPAAVQKGVAGNWITPHASRAPSKSLSASQSLPSLPKSVNTAATSAFALKRMQVMQKMVKPPVHVAWEFVPASLTGLDYWKAIELFDRMDVYHTGFLDKMLFHRAMSLLYGSRDCLDQRKTDKLFENIDFTGWGSINLEEFLGWLFNTHSRFCGRIRTNLAKLNPDLVMKSYHGRNRNADGFVDREEFSYLVSEACPGQLTPEQCDHLFHLLDANECGEIFLVGFFDWLDPKTRLEKKEQGAYELPPWMSKGKIIKNPTRKGKEALFETAPGKPLELVFTAGRTAKKTIHHVKKTMFRYPDSLIVFTFVADENFDVCSEVVVNIGRRIVVWNRTEMIPYMDDPFKSQNTARKWLEELFDDRMPTLLPLKLLRRREPDALARASN